MASGQESRQEYLGRLMSPESMKRNEHQLQELMKAQSVPDITSDGCAIVESRLA
ncbi:MAG: hypothetical protein IT346_04925 [Epsilonproteobacteria bacterium]|nr:hypothetical protein [Campylobacterota bacterium]